MTLARRRPKRQLSIDRGPASDSVHDLGEPVLEPVWIEPYPDGMLGRAASTAAPEARSEVLESVELAFVAALQHLPATQRAVVILRDVLAFSGAQVAALLDTTVPSVNSARQCARSTFRRRLPANSQQATLRSLGERGQRELVEAFVVAWERADVPAILDLERPAIGVTGGGGRWDGSAIGSGRGPGRSGGG